MKNFSDLLATELLLCVQVNGSTSLVPLHQHMTFCAADHVTVDGIEILPKYRHLANYNQLVIAQPFYRWYHVVSGQGWLLTPQ
jgi:hypothetical protein